MYAEMRKVMPEAMEVSYAAAEPRRPGGGKLKAMLTDGASDENQVQDGFSRNLGAGLPPGKTYSFDPRDLWHELGLRDLNSSAADKADCKLYTRWQESTQHCPYTPSFSNAAMVTLAFGLQCQLVFGNIILGQVTSAREFHPCSHVKPLRCACCIKDAFPSHRAYRSLEEGIAGIHFGTWSAQRSMADSEEV